MEKNKLKDKSKETPLDWLKESELVDYIYKNYKLALHSNNNPDSETFGQPYLTVMVLKDGMLYQKSTRAKPLIDNLLRQMINAREKKERHDRK